MFGRLEWLVNGETEGDGFNIYYGGASLASTHGYKKKIEEEWMPRDAFLLKLFLVVAFGTFLSLQWLIIKAEPELINLLVGSVFAWLASVAFASTIIRCILGINVPLRTAQWHGAEHMVVRCLVKKLEPTAYNLKRQSKWSVRCSTIFFPFLLCTASNCFLLYSYVVVQFISFKGMIMLVSGYVLLVIISSTLIQHYFSTTYPTESQLEETLLALKEAHSKLEAISKY